MPSGQWFKRIAPGVVAVIFIVVFTAVGGIFVSCEEVASIEKELLQKEIKPIQLDDVKLQSLPKPVQRYATFVLGNQKNFPAAIIRWEEKGTFHLPKLGKFDMDSWQISRTDSPHYLWRGFMQKLGGLLTLESRDYFAITRHDMRAKFWGLKTIMRSDYKNPEELRSLHSYLLLRYYGSALDFPWVLFSDPNIHWESKDANHAWLIARMGEISGRYLVTFEEDGHISKMESPDYRLHGNGENLREIAEKSDYISYNGIKIPSHMKYTWLDQEGHQTTYEFHISNITNLKE